MKTLLRSFAGGEITPELYGRPDLVKYQTGLAKCLNFTVLPHGPITRRPGLQFRAEVKDSTKRVRLIPFAYSAEQTVVLEFGDQYVRFHVSTGAVLESTVAITSIVGSTVTTTGAHGYSTGDDVYIGTRFHRITVTGGTTFTTADRWGTATTASGTTAARVYTLSTPYLEADLFNLHYAQDADVLTITHPSYATRELARLGASSWTLTSVSFAAPTNAPTVISVTETIAQNQYLTDQIYVITSVVDDGNVESLPSAEITATNNLGLAGNYNTITWTPVTGASRYNVYKRRGGSFGYIGQAKTETTGSTFSVTSGSRGDGSVTVTLNTSSAHGFLPGDSILVKGVSDSYDGVWTVATVPLTTRLTYLSSKKGNPNFVSSGTVQAATNYVVDDNVVPDMSQVPPDDVIALNGEEDAYPAAVTYFEQRRWFGGTNSSAQGIWATRNGTQSNLTSSVPTRDDDALQFKIASREQNAIRHLVPLSDIIALTVGGEFRIFADSAPNITPTSLSIKPQGYAGASNVQPVVTPGSILYVQAQGSRVREMAYNWQNSAYSSIDVSIMAPHLFDTYTLVDVAYVRAPVATLWAVRSDGTLLGLTYVPEQEVYGWHQHTTDGVFESVAVVAEGLEDALYAVVRRTINGRSVRYVERLQTRFFANQDDAFYVDCGLTYDSTPITTVSGLWHLEGRQVRILADGAVHPVRTVTSGAVTLESAASVVHVGLAYTSDMQTLPLAFDVASGGQFTRKNVNGVAMRVTRSNLVKAGPSFDKLTEYPARDHTDPYGSPPSLKTAELRFAIGPSWNSDATVCVRQDQPLPLTVLNLAMDVAIGG